MGSEERTDYLKLQATYLRPPNAQKNKKLLEAMGMKQE
jgi:tRNA threonylcarbamoyladenosine biosynthesis protein TsaB